METVWCAFNEWYLVEDQGEDPHKDLLAIFKNKEDALKFAFNRAEREILDDESEKVIPLNNADYEGYQIACSTPGSYDWYYVEEAGVN